MSPDTQQQQQRRSRSGGGLLSLIGPLLDGRLGGPGRGLNPSSHPFSAIFGDEAPTGMPSFHDFVRNILGRSGSPGGGFSIFEQMIVSPIERGHTGWNHDEEQEAGGLAFAEQLDEQDCGNPDCPFHGGEKKFGLIGRLQAHTISSEDDPIGNHVRQLRAAMVAQIMESALELNDIPASAFNEVILADREAPLPTGSSDPARGLVTRVGLEAEIANILLSAQKAIAPLLEQLEKEHNTEIREYRVQQVNQRRQSHFESMTELHGKAVMELEQRILKLGESLEGEVAEARQRAQSRIDEEVKRLETDGLTPGETKLAEYAERLNEAERAVREQHDRIHEREYARLEELRGQQPKQPELLELTETASKR